jgi:hypothetical protein
MKWVGWVFPMFLLFSHKILDFYGFNPKRCRYYTGSLLKQGCTVYNAILELKRHPSNFSIQFWPHSKSTRAWKKGQAEEWKEQCDQKFCEKCAQFGKNIAQMSPNLVTLESSDSIPHEVVF